MGKFPYCDGHQESNKRDHYIDLLRGIGIIAVVVGHAFNTDIYFSNGVDSARKFCYFFHLAIFFFCSGYLYKVHRPRQFFVRIFKKYYFPFILVGLSSLILYPLWNYLGVVTSLGKVDILHKVKNIILFENDGLLTGAMWFVIFFAMAQLQYTFINYCTSSFINKLNVSFSLHNLNGIVCWTLGFCGLYIVSVHGGGDTAYGSLY